MRRWTGVKTVRKMFAVLLAFGACAAAYAGTVRTVTAPALTLDTRIGLVKVVEDAATLRLSTRWDGAESGTLMVNGEEVRALGVAEEADHRLDGLAPGEYVCRWTAGDAAYLATFSVCGDGTARPPRTGVEVTVTGHTATSPTTGARSARAGSSSQPATRSTRRTTSSSRAARTRCGRPLGRRRSACRRPTSRT